MSTIERSVNRYVIREDMDGHPGNPDHNLRKPPPISVQMEVYLSYRAFAGLGIPRDKWLEMLHLSRRPPNSLREKGA